MRHKNFRGYLSSRPVNSQVIPQRVQNLVIRQYARQNDLSCLLSAAEYAMINCIIVLQGVLEELESLRGVIFYSLWQLPEDRALRRAVYQRFLVGGNELHFALEQLLIRNASDVSRVEDLWLTRNLTVTDAWVSALFSSIEAWEVK